MPKRINKQEFDKITALLAAHIAGSGMLELEQTCKAAGLDFDRRTLQRRLRELIKANRVVTKGKGRAIRYLLAPIAGEGHAVLGPIEVAAPGEAYVPLSTQGMKVKRLVRQPITKRKPVGYNRAFLESYEPNRSAYLPNSVRSHLHALGRSPEMEHAAGTYAREILNRLTIDLSWASSRLEGNTYGRLETQRPASPA